MSILVKNIRHILFIILMGCTLSVFASEGANKELTIEVQYGDQKPARTIEYHYVSGSTALEALQSVAEVETAFAGPENRVVTAIDGVRGERGVNGWYYQLDGENARQMADSQTLDGHRSMTWRYKTDICSKTVDGPASHSNHH